MKAVRLLQIAKPLEEIDIQVPDIGRGDVLVRVAACGICHSDAHYRAGISRMNRLPVTLGHEVAGRVEAVGEGVANISAGQRVCLHYLAHCGVCSWCLRGHEQFCDEVQMIGKHRDGGYAEFIKIPARNAFVLPDEISFEQGAVMMCSSATVFHALNKARFQPGETVAIFGFGGLGFSALQLVYALGCEKAFVVDINPAKLILAAEHQAIAIDATVADPVGQIREASGGNGVDVSLELVGLPETMRQAIRCLGVLGRAAIVGLTCDSLSFMPYTELINKEAEVIGVSDHLATELPSLIEFARAGKLQFPPGTLRSVSLDAAEINSTLDALDQSTDSIRTVIVPNAG